jgi:ADP-ribosylglycohydrolase
MKGVRTDLEARRARARLSLAGLSVGDAFGERFFGRPDVVARMAQERAMPRSPWKWTDDTAMALSIVETLEAREGIDEDYLAQAFARRFREQPDRGYGRGAYEILSAIGTGVSWRVASKSAFDGTGSMGNGGAMRSAPVGGYFAHDLDAVVDHARRSASPTHAHPDGVAGAIAVAVAAALVARNESKSSGDLIKQVIARTPAGATREGLTRSLDFLDATPEQAAMSLGSGAKVISSDTVPFSILSAARHVHSYEECLWFTVRGLGDRDTTCAIAGGIVALSPTAPIPDDFLDAREPLPENLK